jgi:hypothetical protein
MGVDLDDRSQFVQLGCDTPIPLIEKTVIVERDLEFSHISLSWLPDFFFFSQGPPPLDF